MLHQSLQIYHDQPDLLDNAMLAACVRELGPLSAEELRAFWWPTVSLAAVKQHLGTLVQQGLFVATSVAGTGQPRRTRYYHPATPRFIAPNTFASQGRCDTVSLLAALRRLAGFAGASSTTLTGDGSGRIVLLRRDPVGLNSNQRFEWLTEPQMSGPLVQSFVLIPDHAVLSGSLHRTTAQSFAARCHPATWPHGFPPPLPLVIAATPERQRTLGPIWAQEWAGRSVLMTTRTMLDHHGWLAPIWHDLQGSSRKKTLLDEEYTPIPTPLPAWETQECW